MLNSPNGDKAFDTTSFAYELARVSGGVAVTAIDMAEVTEMQVITVYNVPLVKTQNKKS